MRTAPSLQLHPRGTEWLMKGFSLGAGAPCELSSMPRRNTQFYHSHLKEPSSRVYQIQQSKERADNSLLTVLGHGWLPHPQWWCGYIAVFCLCSCLLLWTQTPSTHISFQGTQSCPFYFLLFSTLQLHSPTWDLSWPDTESPSFSRVCSSIPSKVC